MVHQFSSGVWLCVAVARTRHGDSVIERNESIVDKPQLIRSIFFLKQVLLIMSVGDYYAKFVDVDSFLSTCQGCILQPFWLPRYWPRALAS